MKNLTDTLSTVAIGTGGSIAAHVVNSIDPSTLQTVFNLAIQVIIGIVTLWGIFAKKKPTA